MKPWLTMLNPVRNWKPNTSSFVLHGITHVLKGRSRSNLRKYALQCEKLVKSGKQVYVIKLNTVEVDHESSVDSTKQPEYSSKTSWRDFCRKYFRMFYLDYRRVCLPRKLKTTKPSWNQGHLHAYGWPPAPRIQPLSGAQLAEVRGQLQQLHKKGFTCPSTSPFGAPVLLIPKKDGGWKLCIDYRALN